MSPIWLAFGLAALLQSPSEVPIDAPYVETPHEIVLAMLKLGRVTRSDIVYDLGSGDGRIVIAAAKEFYARGVGIEHSPVHIAEARLNAARAGVAARVEFRQDDLFEADIRGATVVTLYLLPAINRQLRPKLLAELKPGTRIVSHTFDMGDWKPERTIEVRGAKLYLWTVAAK